MSKVSDTFEVNKIIEQIEVFTNSERSLLLVRDIKMLKKEEAVAALDDLYEMTSLLVRFGKIPLTSSPSFLRIIKEAKVNQILTPQDLDSLVTDSKNASNIANFFKKIPSSYYPNLEKKVDNFIDLTSLEEAIRKVISPSLSINDNASPTLKDIRRKIESKQVTIRNEISKLSSTYKDYLSSVEVTLRDGHFVLGVSSSYKNKVPGIIIAISDSEQTTFIEPSKVVELDNELFLLQAKEREEITRLLKELTSLVIEKESDIENNNLIIATLDFIKAKAMYCNENNFSVIKLVDKRIVKLEEARHPLIDKNVVVANSFHLDENKRVMLISGPNAGGKTVAIKTVGLLIYMVESGLGIPAREDSELSYFDHIYIDIGDNQSLGDNLSTFSAHMSNVAFITNRTTSNDIFLIDELGTGTDPQEGEALAISITKYLLKKNSFGIISSHFSKLKAFALTHENIINASMIFDEKKLEPTYKLKENMPGKSYGVAVSSRYGIRKEIIEDAKKYLDKGVDSFENNVSILESKILEADRLIAFNKNRELELDKKKKRIDNEELNLEKKKEFFLQDVTKEKEEMIKETKDKLDEIQKDLLNPQLKAHEVIKAKKKLEEIEEDKQENITFDEPLEINDYALVVDLGIRGRVVAIKKDMLSITSRDGITYKVDRNRCQKCLEPKEIKRKNINVDNLIDLSSVPQELNIIGQYTEDGVRAVDEYLDKVRRKNLKRVRIIHGFGSGKLRKAVHEYLKKQDFVASFKLADEYEGGGGATIVNLK